MAYLTKEQYDRRRENAASRSKQNESIAVDNGMEETQANLISELCSVRHELHTNMDHVVKSDEIGIKKELVKTNKAIKESGLTPCSYFPSETDDYIDIDDIDSMYYWDEVPEDDKERQEWYDSNYARIYGELEDLNDAIEKYLASIDEKYHTHFCPTGALRLM